MLSNLMWKEFYHRWKCVLLVGMFTKNVSNIVRKKWNECLYYTRTFTLFILSLCWAISMYVYRKNKIKFNIWIDKCVVLIKKIFSFASFWFVNKKAVIFSSFREPIRLKILIYCSKYISVYRICMWITRCVLCVFI